MAYSTHSRVLESCDPWILEVRIILYVQIQGLFSTILFPYPRAKLRTMICHAQWLASVVLLLFSATHVQAETCLGALIWGKTCVPDCVRKYCCDDYCSKIVPCTRGVKTKCCDNYSGKPTPCVREVCTVCNDYCSKCSPKVSCPARDLKCNDGYASERCESPAISKTAISIDVFRK